MRRAKSTPAARSRPEGVRDGDREGPRHMSDAGETASRPPGSRGEAAPIRPAASPRRFKTPRTIGALILREMQTTYGRSPGGYAWAFLEPIGGIALLTLILVSGFRVREPALGSNFQLFFASGLLVLTMFLAISGRVAQSINFSRNLLFYPGVKYTDALIARFLLNMLTQTLVFLVIVSGIVILFDVQTIIDPLPILAGVGLTGLVALGIGTLNCFLFNMVPVWEPIWQILTRPLFLVSTVFFTFEQIPQQYQDIGWWNPLVHLVALIRQGLYPSYDAYWVTPLYPATLGTLTLVFGLLFLRRFHGDILNR
jgi:capsular polysaccharide transport system permease protein